MDILFWIALALGVIVLLSIILDIADTQSQIMKYPRVAISEQKWIAYYIPPGTGQINYLCRDVRSGETNRSYIYSPQMEFAHRFDTMEEAMAALPVYDGSTSITDRVGVRAVRR